VCAGKKICVLHRYIITQWGAIFWAREPNQEKKKDFAGQILNNTYTLYLCIVNYNILSSVVPKLERLRLV
jgi:disulfide oxidoreductase YuzD